MPSRPPKHKPRPNTAERKVERKKRISSSKRGYGRAWGKYSKRYRVENPWCVMCLPKIVPAKCVDHITPVTGPNDPAFYDPGNHQSLCWSCHSRKTAAEDGGFGNNRAVSHPDWLPIPQCAVTILCGAPGSGKTTYVHEHAGPNDKVIDLDECVQFVSGVHGHDASEIHIPTAIRVRNRMLADLASHAGHAWFIVSAPTEQERMWWTDKLKATVVLLPTPMDVCLKRIQPGPNYDKRISAVRSWFNQSRCGVWKAPKKRYKP